VSSTASLLARFDKLSLRERALVALAVLAVLVGLWDVLFMQPLRNQRNVLTQELSTYNETVGSPEQADQADPHRAAIMRLSDLQTQQQSIDA